MIKVLQKSCSYPSYDPTLKEGKWYVIYTDCKSKPESVGSVCSAVRLPLAWPREVSTSNSVIIDCPLICNPLKKVLAFSASDLFWKIISALPVDLCCSSKIILQERMRP